MSLSYQAVVVCGFQLTIESVMIPKAKFNPDTGVPYKDKEHSHFVGKIDGVFVASDQQNEDVFCEGEKLEDLLIGNSGGDDQQKWLGVPVVAVGDYEDNEYFAELPLDIPPEVTEFAEKHGVEPRWFLSMSY